jgi:lipoprotein-anchoring transpeptidase ErfK/SrfK
MIRSPFGSSPSAPRALARSRRLARGPATVLAVALLSCSASGSAVASGAVVRVPKSERLALLLSAHAVHREPVAGSSQTVVLPAHTPITGAPTTLPVTGALTGANGIHWLQVMLPGRPNSSTGWIAQQGTRKLLTGWHVVIDLAARQVLVYSDGRQARSFAAVVGKPSTPTPTGQFFVEETVAMAPGEPGGPFALALSARSDALQEFEGGPGQIALHGRDNLGGTLGAAASHGCVRLSTASIDWLSTRIGPGVPVTIDAG